jgi:hypothetical protein
MCCSSFWELGGSPIVPAGVCSVAVETCRHPASLALLVAFGGCGWHGWQSFPDSSFAASLPTLRLLVIKVCRQVQ